MSVSAPAQTSDFQKVAAYRNLGGVPNSLVGPGPTPGSQRFYLSYMYVDNTLEIVAVDPVTGATHVYENPTPGEFGAWAMTPGDDGNIYVGTLPHAHLLRLDPRAGTFVDLGRPSDTEQYIWNMAVGPDHKIYGCTYPSAKLIRYDPVTGRSEDLGRLDPTEQYARFIAADHDGYVYVGIGTSRMNIAAFNIATGVHREILPQEDQTAGIAQVFLATDGHVYGKSADHSYRLTGGQAVRLPTGSPPPVAASKNAFADGQTIEVHDDEILLHDPASKRERRYPYPYQGRSLSVFRLSAGPQGQIYGSGVLPSYFFRLDPESGETHTYGLIGGGESYSLLAHGDRVLIANYSGDAPLMAFDPRKPFARGKGPDANPSHVTFTGAEGSWRPMAMIPGEDGKVYLGAVSAYGKLGGPLAVWDPETNQVQVFEHLIPDESVVSLALHNGLLYGGTTIGGGGGAHTTKTEATLFVWDPKAQKVLFQIQPVPGEGSITDLIAVKGKIYGLAADTLFVFDPASWRVIKTSPAPFHAPIYNGVALGPDGLIWGAAKEGIFKIDPETDTARLVAQAPEPLTAGFVLRGRDVYCASGAAIYRCHVAEGG